MKINLSKEFICEYSKCNRIGRKSHNEKKNINLTKKNENDNFIVHLLDK